MNNAEILNGELATVTGECVNTNSRYEGKVRYPKYFRCIQFTVGDEGFSVWEKKDFNERNVQGSFTFIDDK